MTITYFTYEEIKNKISDVEHDIYNLFVEVIREENFYKEIPFEEFNGKLFQSSAFKKDGTFVAYEHNTLVGFISGMVRDTDKGNEKACKHNNYWIK